MSGVPFRELLFSSAAQGCEAFSKVFSTPNLNLNDTTMLEGKTKSKTSKLVVYLTETLQEMESRKLTEFWNHVSQITVSTVEKFVLSKTQSEQTEYQDQPAQTSASLNLLQHICSLCTAMLEISNTGNVPDGLVDIVVLLHGILLNLDDKCSKLARSICKLAVNWWCKDYPQKSNLCLHPLIFLLTEVTSFGPNHRGLSSNLTDLNRIKDALKEFDFSDSFTKKKPENLDPITYENILELQQLLILAVVHPSFVKNGRKFLSNALLLHKDLMMVMHKSIVDHMLQETSTKFCQFYGNMYFHAWTVADDDTKPVVEEICIQDLMYRAIHLPRGKNCPFTRFQEILKCVVSHKDSKQVMHMLARLYDPIIWRSLKANNCMVRANSASLLFDIFPLTPASDTNSRQEFDELIQRQFAIVDDLLMDDIPQIRKIAVTGLCNILYSYWDVIPAVLIAVEMQKLYTNLAFDSASIEVREAVFKSTVVLLDNPCSHPILKKLLHTVSHCMHDSSERVRMAFVEMLLSVKRTATILFWEVCPTENILAQMEVDSQQIAKKLTKLLSGSFLPLDQSVQNWVLRCANFYERNAIAARKFYIQSTTQLSCNEIGEFMSTISIFITNNVAKSLELEAEEDGDEEKEQQQDAESKIIDNSDIICGLLETICILWPAFHSKYASAKGKRQDNSESRELAKKVAMNLPRALHVCFKKFHDERIINILLELSSHLPPASIPVFSKGVFPKLKSLPDTAPPSYYKMLISCLVRWGWANQILELTLEWMQESFELGMNPASDQPADSQPQAKTTRPKRGKAGRKSASSKKKSKKQVQFSEATKPARPGVALKYLVVLLADVSSFEKLLEGERSVQLLWEINTKLQKCFAGLKSSLSGDSPLFPAWSDEMLVQGLKLHMEICMRFYFGSETPSGDSEGSISDSEATNQRKEESLMLIKQYIEWAQIDLISQLKSTTQAIQDQNTSQLSSASLSLSKSNPPSTSSILSKISLSRSCFGMLFPTFSDLLKAGMLVSEHVLNFLASFTETGIKTIDYASEILSLHNQLHDRFLADRSRDRLGKVPDVQPPLTEVEGVLLQIFSDVLLALVRYSRQNPDAFINAFRSDVRSRVRALVQSEFQLRANLTRHTYKMYMSKIASAILADHTQDLKSTESHLCEHFSDLPTFSFALLPTICATPAECDYLCSTTLNDIARDSNFVNELDSRKAKAVICLLNTLSKDSKNRRAACMLLEDLKDTDAFAQSCTVLEPSAILSA